MKIQNMIFIAVVMIASIGFLTYPVNAESGNISLHQIISPTYNFGSGGAIVADFARLDFDSAHYNQIDSLYMNLSQSTVGYATNGKSTNFNITGCGSGRGVASYSKASKALAWYFTYPSIITCGTILLNYDSNIFNDISTASWVGGTIGVQPNVPVGIHSNGNTLSFAQGDTTPINYTAVVETITTNHYNITYPLPGFFITNITKVGYTTINTMVQIQNATGSPVLYPIQGDSVTNNGDFAVTNRYQNGITLNMSLVSGVWTSTVINTSGSTIITPTPISINPSTGVGITFDSSTYSIGGIANISWIRTVETPLLCTDYVRLQTPQSKYDLVVSPSNSGYTKELLSLTGTYVVSFERDCLFSGTETLDSNSATVGSSEQASYIFAPAQVGIGQLFNVTYLIGWTKTTGSTVWLRDYSWDNAAGSYSSTYQPWALSGSIGVETNQSILVTQAGKHLLKVCDVLLGCKASTTLEAFFNGSEVTTNISVSNITIDKTSYSYGETILVKTAVDNFNWTNKQIVVEYEDYDQGIIQNQQYIQEQIESFPLYISDLTFSGSGASRLRLTGKNSTGNYILAFVNFTLSNVDSEGYGLSVIGETNCVKDIIQINVAVPSGEVGNLTISADNAKYNKAYTINGTKTINYKYLIDGTYYITLSVNGEAKRNIIKVISSTGTCAIIIPTPTYKGINGTWTSTNENIKDTCFYWDAWVRAIFETQGINDVTRLLFALGTIVAMMFIGMIASKGNFGVAIILGFFPYAFFSYLTLSSPCGQYIPLWINIFIALIIGIKMKWFS